MLPLETIAPDFELYATPDQKLRLSELSDKKIILAFYPLQPSLLMEKDMRATGEKAHYFNT